MRPFQPGQLELLCQSAISSLVRPHWFTALHGQRTIGEVQYPQQLRNVDVLGGQTAAQDVVRVCADFHTGAPQVGV